MALSTIENSISKNFKKLSKNIENILSYLSTAKKKFFYFYLPKLL